MGVLPTRPPLGPDNFALHEDIDSTSPQPDGSGTCRLTTLWVKYKGLVLVGVRELLKQAMEEVAWCREVARIDKHLSAVE